MCVYRVCVYVHVCVCVCIFVSTCACLYTDDCMYVFTLMYLCSYLCMNYQNAENSYEHAAKI